MCDVMMNYVIWRWLISYIFVTTAAAAAAAAYCKLICWCFPRICSAFILVQYGYIVHIICQMVAENVDNPFDDIGFFIGCIAIYGATFTLPTKWK